jgi:hypothetical protein
LTSNIDFFFLDPSPVKAVHNLCDIHLVKCSRVLLGCLASASHRITESLAVDLLEHSMENASSANPGRTYHQGVRTIRNYDPYPEHWLSTWLQHSQESWGWGIEAARRAVWLIKQNELLSPVEMDWMLQTFGAVSVGTNSPANLGRIRGMPRMDISLPVEYRVGATWQDTKELKQCESFRLYYAHQAGHVCVWDKQPKPAWWDPLRVQGDKLVL